jgi:hypothetical protein
MKTHKAIRNRWALRIQPGDRVDYHSARVAGCINRGTVERIQTESTGVRVVMTSGATCAPDDVTVVHIEKGAPVLRRGAGIEVPTTRNGRPRYRWVQGWFIDYGHGRVSTLMRLAEARAVLREAKGKQA